MPEIRQLTEVLNQFEVLVQMVATRSDGAILLLARIRDLRLTIARLAETEQDRACRRAVTAVTEERVLPPTLVVGHL